MKKIEIEIKKNSLIFKYAKGKGKEDNSLNEFKTNVIKKDELIFSVDFILENEGMMANFIKELTLEYKIKKIVMQNLELADVIINLLEKIDNIELLQISSDEVITFSLAEKIVKCNNIKEISCYSAPEFIIEFLDINATLLDSRAELLSSSNFMEDNGLVTYSKIFYKEALRINLPLKNNDLEDLESFCKINKYLKIIHVYKCDVLEIKKIVDVLMNNKKKNIKILIHENVTNEEDVKYLRKINRKWKKRIEIKLVYSSEYIKDNYIKQVIITTIKYTAIILLMIVGCCFGYIKVNNFNSEKNVIEIKKVINEVIEKNDDVIIKEEGMYGPSTIKSLLSVNRDTIGWLVVNNTNIDYPVVQTTNNSYYLKHNYNNARDYSGWVFADYRNDIKNLGRNTIIYAHNRFNSNVMFGSLKMVLNDEWLKDDNNHFITFNTLYKEMKFKIFSVYKINITSDYIETEFNDDEFETFINMIKDRSEYDFGMNINKDDKILTLSTCLENDRRLVVHAVLIDKD